MFPHCQSLTPNYIRIFIETSKIQESAFGYGILWYIRLIFPTIIESRIKHNNIYTKAANGYHSSKDSHGGTHSNLPLRVNMLQRYQLAHSLHTLGLAEALMLRPRSPSCWSTWKPSNEPSLQAELISEL